MTTRLDLFSQTASALILPIEPNGPVQLHISAFTNANAENFGYEYLAIFVENEQGEYDSSAVQGRHTIEGDYLVFFTLFPL